MAKGFGALSLPTMLCCHPENGTTDYHGNHTDSDIEMAPGTAAAMEAQQ